MSSSWLSVIVIIFIMVGLTRLSLLLQDKYKQCRDNLNKKKRWPHYRKGHEFVTEPKYWAFEEYQINQYCRYCGERSYSFGISWEEMRSYGFTREDLEKLRFNKYAYVYPRFRGKVYTPKKGKR